MLTTGDEAEASPRDKARGRSGPMGEPKLKPLERSHGGQNGDQSEKLVLKPYGKSTPKNEDSKKGKKNRFAHPDDPGIQQRLTKMSKKSVVEDPMAIRRSPRDRKSKEKSKVGSPASCASSWQNQDTGGIDTLFKDLGEDSVGDNMPPPMDTIGTSSDCSPVPERVIIVRANTGQKSGTVATGSNSPNLQDAVPPKITIRLDIASADSRVAAIRGAVGSSSENEEPCHDMIVSESNTEDDNCSSWDYKRTRKSSPKAKDIPRRKRILGELFEDNDCVPKKVHKIKKGIPVKGSKGERKSKNDSSLDGTIPVVSVPWKVPDFLRAGWQTGAQEGVPNVRNTVTIHVVEPSYHPMRVTNSHNLECFRIPARVKSTGAFVFAEVPCSAGSPAAIFRDCPELEPYFPKHGTTVPWANTTRYVSSASIMVTTLSRGTRAAPEHHGLASVK